MPTPPTSGLRLAEFGSAQVLYFGETQFDMLPPDALEPFDVAEPKKHSSNAPGMKKAIDLAVARAEELHINLDE